MTLLLRSKANTSLSDSTVPVNRTTPSLTDETVGSLGGGSGSVGDRQPVAAANKATPSTQTRIGRNSIATEGSTRRAANPAFTQCFYMFDIKQQNHMLRCHRALPRALRRKLGCDDLPT